MSNIVITRVQTITGAELGTQLFVGERPDPLRLIPATQDRSGYLNKPNGGLWTSTLHDAGSGWVEWCRAEDFGGVDALPWWGLTPKIDARLVMVHTAADLWGLVDTYGTPYGYATTFGDLRVLDFGAMIAAGFDGMHLTAHGARACHYGDRGGLALNAWDCESTVWFHWAFTDVTKLERRP